MLATNDEVNGTDFDEVNKNNFQQIKRKATKVNNINKFSTYFTIHQGWKLKIVVGIKTNSTFFHRVLKFIFLIFLTNSVVQICLIENTVIYNIFYTTNCL